MWDELFVLTFIAVLFIILNSALIYVSTLIHRLIDVRWTLVISALLLFEILISSVYLEFYKVFSTNLLGAVFVLALIFISWVIVYERMRIFMLSIDATYIFKPTTKVQLTRDLSAFHKKGDIAILGTIKDKHHSFTVWCFDLKVINEFGKCESYEVHVNDVISSLNTVIIVSQDVL